MTPHSHSIFPPTQLVVSRTNSVITPCHLYKHGNKSFHLIIRKKNYYLSIQVWFNYVIIIIRLVVYSTTIILQILQIIIQIKIQIIQRRVWGRWQLLHKDGILYVFYVPFFFSFPPHTRMLSKVKLRLRTLTPYATLPPWKKSPKKKDWKIFFFRSQIRQTGWQTFQHGVIQHNYFKRIFINPKYNFIVGEVVSGIVNLVRYIGN